MLMWRSTHDALMAEKDRVIDDIRKDRRTLLATILRMKVNGASLTRKHVREAQPPVADPIGVAIEARADGDVRMARHLRVMAQQAAAKGMTTEDIVSRIQSTSDEDAG